MAQKRKIDRAESDAVKPVKKVSLSVPKHVTEQSNGIKEVSTKQNVRRTMKFKGNPINESQRQKQSVRNKDKANKNYGKLTSKISTTPPNWNEFKKKKKDLRTSRKQAKIDSLLGDTVIKAKQLSEKLRRKKNSPTERQHLVEQLHNVLKGGSYVKLALAHDTSRIIQWLLKYSAPKIRNDITSELIQIVKEMVQAKYARNCVKKMLKYSSPEYHSKIIESFYGNVVTLASHTFSAPIIDMVFTEYANEKQRCYLQQEFYGDIYKKTKDDSVLKLSDTYKDSPEMKNAILSATKGNLDRILNKNVHDNVLMHAVLYNYLTVCSPDERSEMLTSLCSYVVPLSNSKYGVKVSSMCVQYGTNKDKKIILKVVKEHAVALSAHEHGHLLLLAIFSSVDDTVLVKKTLLPVILEKVKDIVNEEWGRKTILWLVAPGDRKHFHPSFLNWVEEGVSSGTSKKDPAVRNTELLAAILPTLCSSLTEEPQFWLANGSIGIISVAILKAAKGDDLKKSLTSLCTHLCKLDWFIKENEEQIYGIEHPAMHACLKKIALDDQLRAQNGDRTFGEELSELITNETLTHWLNFNRGCFLLICIIESNGRSVQTNLLKSLAQYEDTLKKKTYAGAKILLKKLSGDDGQKTVHTPSKKQKKVLTGQ